MEGKHQPVLTSPLNYSKTKPLNLFMCSLLGGSLKLISQSFTRKMNTGNHNSCLPSRLPELSSMILFINTQKDFTKVTPFLKQHFTIFLYIYV